MISHRRCTGFGSCAWRTDPAGQRNKTGRAQHLEKYGSLHQCALQDRAPAVTSRQEISDPDVHQLKSLTNFVTSRTNTETRTSSGCLKDDTCNAYIFLGGGWKVKNG